MPVHFVRSNTWIIAPASDDVFCFTCQTVTAPFYEYRFITSESWMRTQVRAIDYHYANLLSVLFHSTGNLSDENSHSYVINVGVNPIARTSPTRLFRLRIQRDPLLRICVFYALQTCSVKVDVERKIIRVYSYDRKDIEWVNC